MYCPTNNAVTIVTIKSANKVKYFELNFDKQYLS